MGAHPLPYVHNTGLRCVLCPTMSNWPGDGARGDRDRPTARLVPATGGPRGRQGTHRGRRRVSMDVINFAGFRNIALRQGWDCGRLQAFWRYCVATIGGCGSEKLRILGRKEGSSRACVLVQSPELSETCPHSSDMAHQGASRKFMTNRVIVRQEKCHNCCWCLVQLFAILTQ